MWPLTAATASIHSGSLSLSLSISARVDVWLFGKKNSPKYVFEQRAPNDVATNARCKSPGGGAVRQWQRLPGHYKCMSIYIYIYIEYTLWQIIILPWFQMGLMNLLHVPWHIFRSREKVEIVWTSRFVYDILNHSNIVPFLRIYLIFFQIHQCPCNESSTYFSTLFAI